MTSSRWRSRSRPSTKGKPKQTHLRRAISTAYYGLFHYLIEAACCLPMGGQHAQRGYRRALARGFNHSVMKAACGSFGGGTLPQPIIAAVSGRDSGAYSVPEEIQQLAMLFKEMQEKRHLADYDLSARFKRSEVLTLLDQVRAVVERFEALGSCDDRSFFLASLAMWKEMQSR